MVINMPAHKKKGKSTLPAHRLTRQRRVILEALCKVTTHPAADEVYRMVRKQMPRISLGTVYRNLEVLSEQGKILKLDLSGSQMRFDGRIDHHYHIRCTSCGKMDDLEIKQPVELKRLRTVNGYQVHGHRLEFYGLCGNCT